MTGPLNELAKDINAWANRNGFYDENNVRGFDGHLMLIVSEAAEALEHWRDGRDENEVLYVPKTEGGVTLVKPDGIPIELADILIRTLDTMAHHGIDIDQMVALKMDYNKKRSYRNGGKRS